MSKCYSVCNCYAKYLHFRSVYAPQSVGQQQDYTARHITQFPFNSRAKGKRNANCEIGKYNTRATCRRSMCQIFSARDYYFVTRCWRLQFVAHSVPYLSVREWVCHVQSASRHKELPAQRTKGVLSRQSWMTSLPLHTPNWVKVQMGYSWATKEEVLAKSTAAGRTAFLSGWMSEPNQNPTKPIPRIQPSKTQVPPYWTKSPASLFIANET